MCMFQLGATVSYQEVDHTVSESEGSVEHVLVLSKPLPFDVSIKINTISGDTAGKLYTVATYKVFNSTMNPI